jgi:hypothetical protein
MIKSQHTTFISRNDCLPNDFGGKNVIGSTYGSCGFHHRTVCTFYVQQFVARQRKFVGGTMKFLSALVLLSAGLDFLPPVFPGGLPQGYGNPILSMVSKRWALA